MAAADRLLTLKLVTDVGSIDNTLKGVEGKLAAVGSAFKSFAKGAALGLVLEGINALDTAIRTGIDDFLEQQRVAQNLGVTWSALGLNLAALGGVMDAISGKAISLGFDDADALIAFDAFLTRTRDAATANKLLAASYDLARAKSIPLAQAATELGLIYQGSERTLKKYGVTGVAGMEAVDAAMVTSKGNADVYVTTMQGKWDVLNVKTDEVFETIGGVIVGAFEPVVAFLSDSVVPALDGMMAKFSILAPHIQGALDFLKPILDLGFQAFDTIFVQPIVAAIDIIAALFDLDLPRAVGHVVLLIRKVAGPLVSIMEGIANGISDAFDGALDHVRNAVGVVRDIINNLIDGLNLFLAATGQAQIGHIGMGGNSGTNNWWPKFPKRASGGPVGAGRSYLVGERGPELLRMGSQSGHITSNAAMAGGGNTYNINISGIITDPAATGRQVVKALQAYEAREGGAWRKR